MPSDAFKRHAVNQVNIDSYNDLPLRRQATIWTYVDLLLIGP